MIDSWEIEWERRMIFEHGKRITSLMRGVGPRVYAE